jgi:predicted peptidase
MRHVISGPLPCLVSVPAGAAPDGGWPVLCFLHGYDEAAPVPVEEAATRHGPLSAAASPRYAAELIVVAPQLTAAGDRWHRGADAVARIVDDATEEHGGDRRRTYLTGFSFGGNGVLDLALAQPGRWAALWPVDPTRVPRADPGLPVWLSVGAAARRSAVGFARALDLRALDAASSGERVYLDEGLDHVGSATSAYADERIVRWLLEWKR